MPEWRIYLLRCGDGSIYTGITTNLARRLREHENGLRGAKYLRGRGPFQVIFDHAIGDRAAAARIEHRIKQLPSEDKQDERRLSEFIATCLAESANTGESAGRTPAARV